jgi:gamma-glutamylcyclotransferase (GGCT)/AIG2-like uncharacterized protein YtfP
VRVFAYGSLAVGGTPACLEGFRVVWGVAMDNSVEIPGYKVYVDPRDGSRPQVFVAFVDLQADPDATVDGVVLDVTAGELAELDERERNYERQDVADRLGLDGPVWVYMGLPKSRERLRRALAAGTAVIQRDYFDAVSATTTIEPPCPVVDVVRVDIPAAAD